VPAQTIGASYGDALLAGIGAGLLDTSTDWARAGSVITPEQSRRSLYDDLYGTYVELYPATRELVHGLAERQEPAPPA